MGWFHRGLLGMAAALLLPVSAAQAATTFNVTTQLDSNSPTAAFRPYERAIRAHIVLNSFKKSVTNWRTDQMKIFVFGSSIVSSYWNGAATYYRGVYKYLARLGHEITFAEPDAYGRQEHRDFEDVTYVRSL